MSEIANERAREAVYRTAVARKADRRVAIDGAASFAWTGTGRISVPPVPEGSMFGRVAIDGAPAVTDTGDFYIGTSHHAGDGLTVYNWEAPIASVFFTEIGHPLCEQVLGTRSFSHESAAISDFEDVHRATDVGGSLFAERRLVVPAAPARQLPLPAAVQAPASSFGADADAQPEAARVDAPADDHDAEVRTVAATRDEEVTAAQPKTVSLPRVAERAAPFRAEGLLRKRLERARTDGLGTVLATLQPEQYALVTRNGIDPLIIDGHPGTGKTVIAAHRAAYLTSDDYNNDVEEDLKIRRLLLVGPTDEYVSHVAETINALTGGAERVIVASVRKLLAMAAGLNEVPEGRAITRVEDGAANLWALADNAVTILESRPNLSPQRATRVRAAYDLLRNNGERGKVVTSDPEWARYLRSLPAYDRVRSLRHHAPLLAAIGWHVAPPRELVGFDHVIVDEAQDIMAIEWVLIDAINRSERWTLFGDMNQRRSDAAYMSWNLVAGELAILEDDNTAPVTRVKRGYRSTRPIMAYANQLLPREDRAIDSVQLEGPAVTVSRVSEAALHERAVMEAQDILAASEEAAVAIIGVERPATETVLRRANWTKSRHHPHRWELRGRTIDVLHPDHARGLEWDGVVVVEPSRFPTNFNRHGLLYTSLTRANRELRVVHAQSLPDALKRR